MIENLAPERATCPECGASFLRDAAWKKLCVPCWRKGKARTPPAAEPTKSPTWTPEMQAEIERLRAEVKAERLRADDLQYKLRGTQDCLTTCRELRVLEVAELKAQIERLERRQPAPAPQPALGADLVKRMIRLCHPDIHPVARQAEATEVTQALNAMRGAR